MNFDFGNFIFGRPYRIFELPGGWVPALHNLALFSLPTELVLQL